MKGCVNKYRNKYRAYVGSEYLGIYSTEQEVKEEKPCRSKDELYQPFLLPDSKRRIKGWRRKHWPNPIETDESQLEESDHSKEMEK